MNLHMINGVADINRWIYGANVLDDFINLMAYYKTVAGPVHCVWNSIKKNVWNSI